MPAGKFPLAFYMVMVKKASQHGRGSRCLFYLPPGSGTVIGDGYAGFGEGLHVVEDVHCGIDQAHAQARDAATAGCHVQAQQRRLGMEQVGDNVRAELFSVAGNDFRAFIVQDDEGAVVSGTQHSAEQGGGISLKVSGKMLQKGIRRIAQTAVRLAQGFAQTVQLGAAVVLRCGLSNRETDDRMGKAQLFAEA